MNSKFFKDNFIMENRASKLSEIGVLKTLPLKSAQIIGTGRCVPSNQVTSANLDAKLGLEVGCILSMSGVNSRYFCGTETQIDLAVKACELALNDAELTINEIDTVISACAVPYQPLPSTAPLVMQKLGAKDGAATGFDINSSCLSFVSAVDYAVLKIQAGQAMNVLVFSSEVASRALPWEAHPEVAALFGDGAAAAVISSDVLGKMDIVASLMRTFPSGYDACEIGSGGTRFDFYNQSQKFKEHAVFSMDGAALFKLSSRHFKNTVQGLLDIAGWQHRDVDLVIPHQASPLALAHIARQVKFPPEKIVDISREYGNQIAASIPFTLDIARKTGRIRKGAKVLILGTSAGVSFGGVAIEA